jgi:hypothetical protein
MADKPRGGVEGFKDKLQANRNKILYVLVLLSLFFALAGWALLPDQVGLRYDHGTLSNIVEKNTALVAHLALGVGFGLMFWKWPREVVYLVGSVLGILLSAGVLVTNLGLV